MRLGMNFIRSKLSRRIIALFVICALFPIALLSAISLWSVDSQLRQQAREELRDSTHDEGMSVYERLTFVQADLKLAALSPDVLSGKVVRAAQISPGLARRIDGLQWVSASGVRRRVFGKVPEPIDFTSEERAYLQSGKSLVVTRECGQAQRCVFMARQVDPRKPAGGILIANVSSEYLLDGQGIPAAQTLCILDEQDQPIACSDTIVPPFASHSFQSADGHFQWKQDGQSYEASFWRLFLRPNFRVDHWTIVAGESQHDVLAPIVQFKRIFLLVVVLALWVVLLLSLVQVRRNLIPLGELQRGTRRISKGEFQSRVKVASGDEFEDVARSFNAMASTLEKQFNSLRSKNAIDRAILSSWDIEQIVEALLAHLRSVLPHQLACVSVLDTRHPGQLKCYLRSKGSATHTNIQNSPLPEHELQELVTHPTSFTVSSGDGLPQFLGPLASRGMRCFLVAPVMVRDELAAIVTLGTDASSAWTDQDLQQAREISDEAGVALSNARLLADLQDLNLGILTALARAIDAKSHWTSGHSERVTDTALEIAREMKLSLKDEDILRRGGLLHDVGKIGVPGELLDRPGKLTAEEMAQLREHVEIGRRILEPIHGFAECLPVVLQHHEWIDGSGYPYGLRGEQIAIHARIFAVADCFDALISDRPYRKGMPLDRVMDILQQNTGKQFDPAVMEAFLRVVSRRVEESKEAHQFVEAPAVSRS